MNIETVLALNVSYQQNAWSKIDRILSINNVLLSIQNGLYSKEISLLRDYIKTSQLDKYQVNKKRLPGVTFSGVFNIDRKKEELEIYNSILVLDFDKLSPQEISDLKQILLKDSYVFSFWDSPSLTGIKGLMVLEYQNTINNETCHESHLIAFKSVRDYFADKYTYEIDVSGSDVTRLCFLSYDRNIVIKDSINPFKVNNDTLHHNKDYSKPKNAASDKPLKKLDRNLLYNPAGKNKPSDRQTISSIIRFLSKRNLSITNDYESWFRVAFAISNTFTHDIGESYFLKLCRLDGNKHDEQQSINMLQYCYLNSRGDITLSTIIYYSKLKGYKQMGSSEGG
jgi:hypothetical protein